MTKDELISKQQIEIETLKEYMLENYRLKKEILGYFYSIGQPLNDNVLLFNKNQIKWAMQVSRLVEEINN